jgi:uncharacterized membrane protein YeaQ/YmgE (transglycosylase-associated protein family)
MWNIIGWILIGGLAGWLASVISGGSQRQGCLTNVIVGVVGAALGGAAYNLISGRGFTFNFANFDISSWGGFAVAVVGAVLLLAILRFIQRIR